MSEPVISIIYMIFTRTSVRFWTLFLIAVQFDYRVPSKSSRYESEVVRPLPRVCAIHVRTECTDDNPFGAMMLRESVCVCVYFCKTHTRHLRVPHVFLSHAMCNQHFAPLLLSISQSAGDVGISYLYIELLHHLCSIGRRAIYRTFPACACLRCTYLVLGVFTSV